MEGPIIKKPVPLICYANQWAGFYMIETSVMKELNNSSSFRIFRNSYLPQFRSLKLIQPSNSAWYLSVQSEKWKHQNNVWNIVTVSNKDIITTSMILIALVFLLWTWKDLTDCFGVSIVDFIQVNGAWVYN